MVAIVKCPICGKFYKYGSKCDCGFDQDKIDEILEALREINADFNDLLRLFVYLYDLQCLDSKIKEMVVLAKEILLEEVEP